MVHNITRHARLPFSNAVVIPHQKGTQTKIGQGLGTGMGSVLLNKGGPGSASSYMDIDDYIRQTGNNPSRGGQSENFSNSLSGSGQGIHKISSKLSKLNLDKAGKRKNITMSF
jgi:hypothetical protein